MHLFITLGIRSKLPEYILPVVARVVHIMTIIPLIPSYMAQPVRGSQSRLETPEMVTVFKEG